MQNDDTKREGGRFNPFLKDMLDLRHPMVRLADSIDWGNFEEVLAPSFCATSRARHPETSGRGMRNCVARVGRILSQQCHDKNKVYSVHAPEVECIAKGKAHKQYEFGVKAGLVTTSGGNWIVGAKTYPGNPYDGHTLGDALAQAAAISGTEPVMACCDLGYRGHGYGGTCDVQIVNRYRRQVDKTLRRHWKRRSAIEPVIGHVKTDCGGNRNRLKGSEGDMLNILFAAAAFNMRKLVRGFALFLRELFFTSFRCPSETKQATIYRVA